MDKLVSLPEYLQTVDTVQDVTGLVKWARGQLPNISVSKSLNPSSITVPGLAQHRRYRFVFRG
ncbi:hypothetical protein [Deinococcus ficus]|uniref:hypothetical protein n=1 Tax=Deinococcus ficus TaxID=317577 RepID=UPI0003B3C8A7|nr:hypothetical protein [Deinococcus ficus]